MNDLLGNPRQLEAAVSRAVRDTTLLHARLGHPVATWRDGRVVWLQPDEVLNLLSDRPTSADGPAQ